MDQTELAIYGIRPASSNDLATSFINIDEGISRVAQENVRQFIADSGQTFTATEIEAMQVVEELKTINGIDLAALLMRASRIRRIISENLMTRHPAEYQTLDELAKDNGMSASELSNVLDLADVIFPYLSDLGFNIAILWEEIGKSKFRELTAVLKVLITGEPSNAESVNNSVQILIDDVNSVNEESGVTMTAREVSDVVIRSLVEDGRLLTNAQLRQRVRPTRTPVINGSVIKDGSRYMVFLNISPEQHEMFMRRMTRDFDPYTADITGIPPGMRSMMITRVPEFRAALRIYNQEN